MGLAPISGKAFEKMESYHHLRIEDRRVIYRLVEAGRPVREIAAHLHRHPSTIYRELRRNRHHDEHPPFRGYFPTVAQDKSASRRARGAKVARDPQLASYIIDRLAAAWSPEQIAGYVRRHRFAGLSVCHETIYQYVYGADGLARSFGGICPARADRDAGAMPASRVACTFRWPIRSASARLRSTNARVLAIGKAIFSPSGRSSAKPI